MTKKQRTALFFICALLFILTALAAVFYSQGFRFDFEKKKITQTGAFYFKVLPKSAQVYLDGQLKKKTDFLFGAVFIENLLPKKYRVQIKKEGYHIWEKTLEIKEKGVTEAKNIVLVPESPNFFILAKGVENFFFSPDEKKIILVEGGGDKSSSSPTELLRSKSEGKEENEVLFAFATARETKETGWEIKLYDLKSNVKNHLIKSSDIAKKEVRLFDIIFSPDSKKLLLKIGLGEDLNPVKDYKNEEERKREEISNGVKYFLLDLEKTPAALTSLDFLGKDVKDISFHPKDAQKLFFLKEGKLSEADLTKKEVSFTPLENIFAFASFNGNIYYLEKSGYLFKTDFSFLPREKINEVAFSLKDYNPPLAGSPSLREWAPDAKYEISIFPDFFFLKENEDLYLLNPETKAFEKFFEKTKELKNSPDFGKLIYFSDFEIWVFFLKKQEGQPQKLAGEKLFLTRFSEKIGNVFWLSSHYLIFNSGSKIKISEIDDRDRINIVDLAEFKEPEIYFNQADKKLYLLSEGNLYASEKLLP